VANQNTDIVAVGLLRPGYVDTDGNKSDGERGLSTGDNYNARNTDSIADGINELKRRWHARKVVVVGHSGGAALTANILGRHPAVIDSAVLVSCPCDVEKWRQHMFQVRRAPIWQGEIDTLSPVALMPRVSDRVPVRMFVGTQDNVTPPSLSVIYQAAAARLGKNVELVQLEGKGHDALLDPAVFAALAGMVKP
jgi:pimeloyl-ACP methyl ester carboxylesterase